MHFMKYQKQTLSNGLRIITVPMKASDAVTVMVLVRAGSDYETKEINGLSHFLEHMCFQGTVKRPNTGDISRELDALGAQSNAFTSKEYTGYWAKAHKKHTGKLIEIVSDVYLNSIFDANAIEREKGVVVEEIKMYEDLPQAKAPEIFESLLYGDQPAGWPIIGSEKNVRSLSRDSLVDYRKKHYTASNTIIVVSGGVDSKKVSKLIKETFLSISKGKKSIKPKTVESQKQPQIKLYFKETDQAHIVLGFRSFDIKNKDNTKIGILETILGKGMSSRLFRRLRDDLGICYYVHAHNDVAEDRGYFAIATGLSKDRVKEGVSAILDELRKIKKELVSTGELQKAKDLKIGNMYLNLETSDAYADFYSFQELYKLKINSPEEKEKKILKVSASDIKKCAEKIFVPEKMNLAIVGPYKDKAFFEDVFSL